MEGRLKPQARRRQNPVDSSDGPGQLLRALLIIRSRTMRHQGARQFMKTLIESLRAHHCGTERFWRTSDVRKAKFFAKQIEMFSFLKIELFCQLSESSNTLKNCWVTTQK